MDDLYIAARRDGRRTTFYGSCRCGWQSKTRTSVATVEKDWNDHVAATDSKGQ